jgi:DNA-binding transcriptional MerR regulator
MTDALSHPTLNMSAVVRATGVQPDTLRAWERRYGLPLPERSDGGHRLYSRRDVEIVKWLVDRQDEGLRISQAVELWQTLESEGRDPLHHPRYAGDEIPLADIEVAPRMAITQLKDSWIDACLAYDEIHGENILAQAFALYPPEAVCSHLLIPALAEIGQGWYRHEVSVQQEHFASELAVRRVEALLTASPSPTRSGRIVVACPPHERHRFPPLTVTFLLRRAGWETLYMGEDVPLDHLEEVFISTHPALTVLTAQTLHTAADLLDMALFLRERGRRIAFGGLIFARVPALQGRIPGIYLGDHLEGAALAAEQAMAAGPVSYTPATAEMLAAAQAFKVARPVVNARLRHALGQDTIEAAHLRQALEGIGDGLYACLKLGTPEPLQADLVWLTGLLANYNVDTGQLTRFLAMYAQTVKEHMPDEAAIAGRWLEELTQDVTQS